MCFLIEWLEQPAEKRRKKSKVIISLFSFNEYYIIPDGILLGHTKLIGFVTRIFVRRYIVHASYLSTV